MAIIEDQRRTLPQHVLDALESESRNEVLQALETTPGGSDADFDALTTLASQIMQTPIALVTLLGPWKQDFRSKVGTELTGSASETSFCAHAIAEEGSSPFIIPDASLDERFADNELVSGPLHIRFYAGVPLIVSGEKVGSLCVLDTEPHEPPNATQLAQLASMAGLASSLLQLKDSARHGDIARTALIREKKRHTLALEAASMASWVWDLRTNIIECDALLPHMLGLPASNRLRAGSLLGAIDRRDRPRAIEQIRNALETGEDYSDDYRVGKVDPPRWLAARGRVLDHDQDGRPALVFGVNFDVTRAKTSEERQRLLLREINHRVKNTLATVQALATQTVRHAREPREFLGAFTGRLQALGLAHGLLSDMEWGSIDMAEVVQLQAMPFTEKARPRIHAAGPPIPLSPDQALGLGLIFHELASNALKHGALSVKNGQVDLTWHLEGHFNHPGISILWQERDGPPVSEPTRSGFGSILIHRSLDKVLGAKVEHRFLADGVRAKIALPLA